MAEHSLLEHTRRFLDEELTFRQLHRYMDEIIMQDFRSGVSDSYTTKLAYNLLGMFSEYQIECEVLGDSSEAMKHLRKSISEFISDNSDSISPGMAIEQAAR